MNMGRKRTNLFGLGVILYLIATYFVLIGDSILDCGSSDYQECAEMIEFQAKMVSLASLFGILLMLYAIFRAIGDVEEEQYQNFKVMGKFFRKKFKKLKKE